MIIPRSMRLLAAFLATLGTLTAADIHYRTYVGTYTGPKSKGIYLADFNATTGDLKLVGLAAETPSPSFVAIHPSGKFLYAANEVSNFGGAKSGSVTAFSIQSDGLLKQLNAQSSAGEGPCFVTVDPTGKAALVANYGSGSVGLLPIEADGSLKPASTAIQHTGSSTDKDRQSGPHAHSINPSPNGKFAFAADLGLDKLLVYKLDAAAGTMVPNDPPFTKIADGSGPRHFTIHPSGHYAYVINEMAMTVTAFALDTQKGTLKEIQTEKTLPEGPQKGYSTAEIIAHRSGQFLYGSNRGHNSISVFSTDRGTGKIKLLQVQPTLGKTPRNFNIDPTGNFLLVANADSGNIVVLKIDQKTGLLSPTGKSMEVGSPVCIRFLKP